MIPDELENSMAFNIYRASLLLRRELIRALAEYDMTPEQWQVLAMLCDKPKPVKQMEIVHLSLRDKPTVSRMIKGMVRKGWLEISQDSMDKRATLVSATDEARILQKEALEKLRNHLKPKLKTMGAEVKQRLLADLKHLRNLLGDHPRDHDP